MNSFPILKQLLIDPVQVAESIEATFGEYLPPVAEGYYLPGQLDPVLKAGQYYWIHSTAMKVPVPDVSDDTVRIPFSANLLMVIQNLLLTQSKETKFTAPDIFNEKGDIVVPAKRVRFLAPAPSVPVRGIRMIFSVLEKLVENNEAWMKNVVHLDTVVAEHLLPPYQDLKNDDNFNLTGKLLNMMIDLSQRVQEFVKEDPWCMYFKKFWGNSSIVIERSIDYRIYDWERRMESGEWKK